MGSIGTPEILLILVIALLLFGPRKLPELGKSVGRALREFKRASTDLRETLEKEVEEVQRAESRPTPPPPIADTERPEPTVSDPPAPEVSRGAEGPGGEGASRAD